MGSSVASTAAALAIIGLEALKKVPKAADDGHIIPQPSRVATRA